MSKRSRGKRPALGRGIEALLGDTPTAESPAELPLDAISPNRDQPRTTFDDERLRELADSIATHGVLQPLVVHADDDGYRIIAGERRFRAARLAGLSTVPAVVRSTTGLEHLELALVENLQRADLNPVEEARGYRRLMEVGGHTQEHVARRVGKSRVTVTNALRLLKLPDDMLAAVERGQISAGHARALLAVIDDASRRVLFDRVVAEELSVRATEEAAQPSPAPATPDAPGTGARQPARPVDADLAAMQQRLIEALGTKVDVRGSARRGRISVTYYSSDDLERICERITGARNSDLDP